VLIIIIIIEFLWRHTVITSEALDIIVLIKISIRIRPNTNELQLVESVY